MASHFFAMINRMKFISRWGLMRNTTQENISEHSLETGMIAHLLAVIRNRRFGGQVSPERAAVLAMYHDAPEILTGDLPTPVKYFNPKISDAYKQVESVAAQKLLSMLPEDLREDYQALFFPKEEEGELWRLVKAADKLSALVKCLEEEKAGNREFSKARQTLLQSVKEMDLPEAHVFLDEFLPACSLTLDELD